MGEDPPSGGEGRYWVDSGYSLDGGGPRCESRLKRFPGFTSFLVRERVR